MVTVNNYYYYYYYFWRPLGSCYNSSSFIIEKVTNNKTLHKTFAEHWKTEFAYDLKLYFVLKNCKIWSINEQEQTPR